MTANTLAFSTALALATAALYLYIGVVLRQRQVSTDARLARDLFAAWWIILGISTLIGGVQVLLYAVGALPVWLFLTFAQLAILCIFAALWALQCYLVYLYRGSKRAFVPLAVFYLALYIFVVGFLMWVVEIHPYSGLSDNGWTLVAEPEFELGQGAGLVTIVVLVGPQMAAAIAYARLYRKTTDRTQRYRIAMLTGAILGWFGTSLLATAANASEGSGWQLLSRLIGLTAGAVILAAYKPPGWIRRRFAIRGLDDEVRPNAA